ncbi:hypothetical protein EYF80_058062 [Liparis tanakae]|uniref:Uncharacterized protein n=1 Tax=Liparis tanakae TaxID=230148 RepID=A0A4Z2ET17_9TELE|nr:hypothetical protein EYF80_058062 [Liparis tanakae]
MMHMQVPASENMHSSNVSVLGYLSRADRSGSSGSSGRLQGDALQRSITSESAGDQRRVGACSRVGRGALTRASRRGRCEVSSSSPRGNPPGPSGSGVFRARGDNNYRTAEPYGDRTMSVCGAR